MFQGLPVKDGVVFTTGENGNQTSQLTQREVDSAPSTCLWWPCLIVNDQEDTQGSQKIVRCWEQNLRSSQIWWTPSHRCYEFEDDDNDDKDKWFLIDHADTMQHQELHTTTVQIEELADDKA